MERYSCTENRDVHIRSNDALLTGYNEDAEKRDEFPKEDDPDYLVPSTEVLQQLEMLGVVECSTLRSCGRQYMIS